MKLLAILLLGLCVLVHSSPVIVLDGHDVSQTHAKAQSFSQNTPQGTVSAASASASARFTRSSVAKANSEAGPGGHTSSSAIAAHTPDQVGTPVPEGPGSVNPEVPSGPGPVNPEVPSGPGPVNPGAPSGPGPVNPEVPSGPGPVNPGAPSGPGPVNPDVPSGPIPAGHGHRHHLGSGVESEIGSFQNVEANADMKEGTAIATATNKRSTDAIPSDIQNVKATGNKALATAQNSHPTSGLNVQNAEANGGQLAVATANSGPAAPPEILATKARISRETNLQNVKAQGDKAIATAQDNLSHGAFDKNIQNAIANGGKLAVASVSSGEPGAPIPVNEYIRPVQGDAAPPSRLARELEENSTLQVVKAKGNTAISSADAKTAGDVSTVQEVTSDGQKLAVATATKN